jgi:hypothetical protein
LIAFAEHSTSRSVAHLIDLPSSFDLPRTRWPMVETSTY